MQVQNISNKPLTSTAKHQKYEQHNAYPNRNDSKVKVASLVGSSVGITLAMASILNKLKKGGNPTKITDLIYSEKEVLKLGGASILGGLTGGLLTDKKENAKPKLREAMQQFFGNIVVPVSILALNLSLLKKSKLTMPLLKEGKKFANQINPLIKEIPRVAVTIVSLVGGLEIGNRIMNKVNDKVFNEHVNREVKPSDYSAHVDDLCFASTFIFKNPKIQSFMTKVLPASYLIAGFETGTKKAD